MADQTASSIVIDAPRDVIMEVISDFAAYPDWAHGVKVVEVRESDADGRAISVYFELDANPIKGWYTLRYDWVDDELVSWTLSEGSMLRGLDGAYELVEAADGSTEVTYRLAVDLAMPMIGMLKRKAEKVIIDTALKGLKKRVETVG